MYPIISDGVAKILIDRREFRRGAVCGTSRALRMERLARHLQFFAWGARLPVCSTWDIISGMTGIDETNESQANTLCKSCGLCCSGHLFSWVKLRPAELDPAEALGMNVFRSAPSQRGFSQPCPLWHGQCTIHASPQYPHACRSYKCKLLKEVLAEKAALPHALRVVEEAKEMIHEVEALLPGSSIINFRERLVAQLEGPEHTEPEFRQKARALLNFYETVFGVKDLVYDPEEE